MKKTQTIDLLTTIKETPVSFVSILMLVMLGVGVAAAVASVGVPAFSLRKIPKLDLTDINRF